MMTRLFSEQIRPFGVSLFYGIHGTSVTEGLLGVDDGKECKRVGLCQRLTSFDGYIEDRYQNLDSTGR